MCFGCWSCDQQEILFEIYNGLRKYEINRKHPYSILKPNYIKLKYNDEFLK